MCHAFDSDTIRKPGVVEFRCSDFDGAMFHVWTSHNNENEVNVSLSYGAAGDLLAKGGRDRLNKLYGAHMVAPENGYDVTLQYQWPEIAANRGPPLPSAPSLTLLFQTRF